MAQEAVPVIEIGETDRAVLQMLLMRGNLLKLAFAVLRMLDEVGVEDLSFVTSKGSKVSITIESALGEA